MSNNDFLSKPLHYQKRRGHVNHMLKRFKRTDKDACWDKLFGYFSESGEIFRIKFGLTMYHRTSDSKFTVRNIRKKSYGFIIRSIFEYAVEPFSFLQDVIDKPPCKSVFACLPYGTIPRRVSCACRTRELDQFETIWRRDTPK